ncbi:MAG: hypothetical protein MUF48_16790 [Pirellulaceae bacterium]|jgi:cytochrome c553|nr:hypothetical protein [Pirellulaceae bacterium]
MRRVLLPILALFLGMGVVSLLMGQDFVQETPKHTIKDVMKQAHGAKLLNKVVDGSASKEEKDQLLDLYISMIENKPPKGDSDEWLMKSGRLILASAKVAVGREKATDELKAASNCKACHDAHK